jgi:hypothetical protein
VHLFYQGVDTTSKDRHNNVHCDISLAQTHERYRSSMIHVLSQYDLLSETPFTLALIGLILNLSFVLPVFHLLNNR